MMFKKSVVLASMVSLVSLSSAFANTDYCQKRAELEGKIEWAKTTGQNLGESLDFDKISASSQSGMWTEMVGNNVGSYDVTVGYPGIRGIYRYTVSAKQIGTTADCKITGISQ